MLTNNTPVSGVLVGSTRPGSFNARLADKARELSPHTLVTVQGIDELPFFGEAIEDPTPATVAALRETGQLDNTLIVFTSDNGGERFSDNWPLVGGKMDLTEGGIRVPWIAHWPRVIRPGGVSRQLCMTMDWSATVLAAADVVAHADYPLDGVSLMPVLQDASHEFPRPLYWRMNHRDQRALRCGDWKYLKVDEHEYLFNIPEDERERANRAGLEPQRLAELRSDWLAWNESMPPIPPDATVSLGYSTRNMPQR